MDKITTTLIPEMLISTGLLGRQNEEIKADDSAVDTFLQHGLLGLFRRSQAEPDRPRPPPEAFNQELPVDDRREIFRRYHEELKQWQTNRPQQIDITDQDREYSDVIDDDLSDDEHGQLIQQLAQNPDIDNRIPEQLQRVIEQNPRSRRSAVISYLKKLTTEDLRLMLQAINLIGNFIQDRGDVPVIVDRDMTDEQKQKVAQYINENKSKFKEIRNECRPYIYFDRAGKMRVQIICTDGEFKQME